MGRGASSRRGVGAAVAVLLLVACSSGTASPAVTVPATSPATPAGTGIGSTTTVAATAGVGTTTSAAPTTTAVPATIADGSLAPSTIAAGTVTGTAQPSSAAPSTTVAFTPPVLAEGCGITAFGGTSTVTFVTGGRLYELSDDQTGAACLDEIAGAPATELAWSPSAGSVLLDGSRVVDAKGRTRDTGYLAGNTGVTWSYPTGKALIAPAVANGALLWRTAGQPGTRLDVSFLARTDLAVYHPAGKNIFATGTDTNGVKGIFVASNRGANVRTVATLNDQTTSIIGLAPDVSGDSLYVLHDEHDMWDVHVIAFPSLVLSDVYSSNVPLSHLTIGTQPGSPIAVQAGDCAAGPTHTIVPRWSTDPIGAGSPLATMSTTPVGFLDVNHLVVAARAGGCEGPVDVWVVPAGGPPHQVLAAVDEVAVRAAVTDVGELPSDINSQAPG